MGKRVKKPKVVLSAFQLAKAKYKARAVLMHNEIQQIRLKPVCTRSIERPLDVLPERTPWNLPSRPSVFGPKPAQPVDVAAFRSHIVRMIGRAKSVASIDGTSKDVVVRMIAWFASLSPRSICNVARAFRVHTRIHSPSVHTRITAEFDESFVDHRDIGSMRDAMYAFLAGSTEPLECVVVINILVRCMGGERWADQDADPHVIRTTDIRYVTVSERMRRQSMKARRTRRA